MRMRGILLLRFLVRKLRQAFFLVAYVRALESRPKGDRAQNANEQSLEIWNLDHKELSRIEEADDAWRTLLRTQVLDFLKNRNDRTRAEDVREWFRGLNGEEIISAENQEPTNLHPAGLPESTWRQFFDRERFLWKLRRVALILFGGVEKRHDAEEERERRRFLGACVQFVEKIETFLSDPAQFKRPRRTLLEAYREVQQKLLDADNGKTYLQLLRNSLKERNAKSFRVSEAEMLSNWRSWWTGLTSEADSEGSVRQHLAKQRAAVSLGRKFEGEANGGSPILWRILSGSVLDPYLVNGLAREYFMGNDYRYSWQARSFDRETATVSWQRPLWFAFLFLCVPHLGGISKSELLHPHILIGGVGRLAANFRAVVLDLEPGIPDEEGKKVSAEQLEKKTSWRKVHTLMRSRVWRELIAGTGGRKAKRGCDSALDELLQMVFSLTTADELVDIRATLSKIFPPPRLASAPPREEQGSRDWLFANARQAEERDILAEIKDIRAKGGRGAARVGLIEELLAYLQDDDVRFFSGGWTPNEEGAGREAWQGLRTMVQIHANARQQIGHLLPPLGRDLADDLETHEDPQRGLYAAEIALWSAVGLLFVAGVWVGVLLRRKCRERAKLLSPSRGEQRGQVAFAGRVGEERAPSVILERSGAESCPARTTSGVMGMGSPLASTHLGDPCRLPLSATRHEECVRLDLETEGAPAAALPAEVQASLFTGGNTRQALMGLDDWNTVPAQVPGEELEKDDLEKATAQGDHAAEVRRNMGGGITLISYQEVAPVRR